jgi:hypothetical protein
VPPDKARPVANGAYFSYDVEHMASQASVGPFEQIGSDAVWRRLMHIEIGAVVVVAACGGVRLCWQGATRIRSSRGSLSLIELLLDEWRGMFSCHPGRTEGLVPLTSLLSLICRKPQMVQLDLYKTKEWQEIVGLRGPVETVLIQQCGQCQVKYARMGISGFLGIIDLLCNTCGGIHFESAYDAPKETACPCGGKAKVGCPACGSIDGTTVEEVSPYQYFADPPLYRHNC